MKLYVLDTDIVTLYRKGHPLVCGRVNATPAWELAISILIVDVERGPSATWRYTFPAPTACFS